MSFKIHQKRKKGFTITEVVVASGLLIIAIIPILKALTGVHISSRIIEHRTNSLIYAQAKLDEVKARSIYNYDDSFSQTNSVISGSYLCNIDDTSINSNLRKITVSVGYDSDDNSLLGSSEIELTLSTLIAKRQ